ANPQKQQQEIREVQLFFDRERPERAVDRVGRAQIEVVQHEHMKQHVPQVKAGHMNGSFVCGVTEIERERGKVRRVQAPDSSLPEGEEVDYRFLNTGGASLGPEQVNTKTGDDEEKVNAGECEVDDIGS